MLSAKLPWPNIYMMPANIGKESQKYTEATRSRQARSETARAYDFP